MPAIGDRGGLVSSIGETSARTAFSRSATVIPRSDLESRARVAGRRPPSRSPVEAPEGSFRETTPHLFGHRA